MKYSIILDATVFHELQPLLGSHCEYHGRISTLAKISVDYYGACIVEDRLPGQVYWPARAAITVPQVRRGLERLA